MMVAFLNKGILWEKKKLDTSEQGILSCPPNYTKNRKVRNFLDVPDHSPRASRGKVWRNQKGSQTKTRDLLPFQECRRGTAQYSNSKAQRDRIRDSSVLIP